MVMPATLPSPDFWTAERVRQLPEDGLRHEVVYGEHFVTPAPSLRHQMIIHALADRLKRWLDRQAVGVAFILASDISTRVDSLVQPDLFVAPEAELRSGNWAAVRTLKLVVEVLSPSSARADRFAKRRLYQEMGVPDYWVIDAENRLVECWTPAAQFPMIEREELVWHPEGARQGFRVRVEDVVEAR